MEKPMRNAKPEGASSSNPPALCAVLTPRELEVLEWLAQGLSYKQIADKLKISTNTVNNHLANARCKLGVHSAIEAINHVFPRP